jgi:NAD-dependent SIR2 family protein deacetylase
MKSNPSLPTWVILLGAGASVEAGYPLYRDITDEAGIRNRFSRFLSADSLTAEHEFDDLFSRCAEISKHQVHFEQFLKEAAENDPNLLQFALDYYHDLLTVPDYHLKLNILVSYLRLFLKLPLLISPVQIVIISFNHDLLVERCLDWDFYYGGSEEEMTFRSCSFGQNPKEPLVLGKKHFPTDEWPPTCLIKLHGSLNWLRCRHCGIVAYSDIPLRISKAGGGFFFLLLYRCPKCGQNAPWETTLVPPTTEKDINQVAPFWASAREAMSSAAFITIAGFSFPEYDRDAWTLLDAIGNPGGVEIIDPSPSAVIVKIFNELSQRGISCIPHWKTVKGYTRWQVERFYGFDPFPDNCEEFQGPALLKPLW